MKTQNTPTDSPHTNNLTKPNGWQRLTDGLEGVGVLVGLGLSERQARVYLALLKAGGGSARVVASCAGVPRQEAYGLLSQLR